MKVDALRAEIQGAVKAGNDEPVTIVAAMIAGMTRDERDGALFWLLLEHARWQVMMPEVGP